MKVVDLEQGSQTWLDFRKGKVSGSKDLLPSKLGNKSGIIKKLKEYEVDFDPKARVAELEALLPEQAEKDLIKQQDKKMVFYEILAERLAVDPDDEDRMDRGLRLEQEAADLFAKKYEVELIKNGCWQSDESENIIISPDRVFKDPTKAVEIKCLSSPRHLQAVCENEIPSEYDGQVVQYFVVNKELETLYVVFYDPRIPSAMFHVIEVHRKDLGDLPEKVLRQQLYMLEELDRLTEELAF